MGSVLVIEVEATGERRRHERGKLRIGRSADNDWTLPDPGPTPSLSRRHCTIEEDRGAFTVVDLGSTNGTRLNGRLVPAHVPTPLAAGDRLELGQHMLRLALEEAAAAAASGARSAALLPELEPVAAWSSTPPPASAGKRSLDTLLGGLAKGETLSPPASGPGTPPPLLADDGDPLGNLFRESLQPVAQPLPPRRDVGSTPGDHAQPQLAAFAVPTSRPAATPAPPPSAAGAFEAFLAGAGLAPGELQGDPAQLMRTAGEAFAALAVGLRDLLATRALVKDHAGVARTVIGPVENNPLKHAAGRAEVVRALLAPRAPGYLEPLAALAASVEDLKAHELALLEGVQAALAALLAQFDPKGLEQRLEESSVLGLFLQGGRRAKLWELYTERFEEIAEAARVRFMGDMDRAFANAYERKVRELRLRPQAGEIRR